MKLPPQKFLRSGTTLLELLVYIAAASLISWFAIDAYQRCVDNAKNLQRNASDIVRALEAGERWREDVRRATLVAVFPGGLELREGTNSIEYALNDRIVWRRANTGQWSQFLAGINSSRMDRDARQNISACRWELELESKQKKAKVRPLFTFLAVPRDPQTE